VLHAAAGRYDEARVALEAALRANPAYAVALENLGDVYARLAERAWQRAQSLDARNPRLAPKLKAVQGLLDTPTR
jgi:tetratricopeptide (TPR) repeat protein